MNYLLALLLPWLLCFRRYRPAAGCICLLLQLTLFGWPLATLWALGLVHQGPPKPRIRDLTPIPTLHPTEEESDSAEQRGIGYKYFGRGP